MSTAAATPPADTTVAPNAADAAAQTDATQADGDQAMVDSLAAYMRENGLVESGDDAEPADAEAGAAAADADKTKPNTPPAGQAADDERKTPADGASIPAGGERQPPARPDAALLRRAQLHAIDPSEWAGNVDVLRSLVTFADRRAADAALRTTDATKTAGTEPPASKTPKADKLKESGLYDDVLIETIRSMELENAALQGKVDSQVNTTETQAADAHYGAIDAEVGKLDEELFGKGGFTEVSEANQAERRRVAKLVDRMIEDHEEAGEKWDYPTVVRSAFAARHPDRVAKKATDSQAEEVAKTLSKRKGTPTGRPSNAPAKSLPASGDDKALEDHVRQYMVEHNLPME